MRRRNQLADLLRIDELAMQASGELATAAVLANRQEGLETINAAAEFASRNPNKVAKLLANDLYFRWISETFLDIRKKTTGIDIKKIGTFDRASQSTKGIFEDVIASVNDDLDRQTSGVYTCIQKIFNDESKYTAEALDQIKNIKLLADQIKQAVRRIGHPYLYVIYDRRLIVGFLVAFIVAIPVWYFFGAHGQSVATLPEQTQVLINADVLRLRQIAEAQNTSIFVKVAYFIRFAWDFLLAVPSLLLLPAAVIAFARRRRLLGNNTLRRSEALFGDIGKELQKVLPSPTRLPPVRLSMSNIVVGSNIQQIIDSTITDSFNKIDGTYDHEVTTFLKEVGDTVKKSGDKDAADHYGALVENLKNDKKSMARTMWDGLVKALPSVTAVAGAATAIAKIFGPS